MCPEVNETEGTLRLSKRTSEMSCLMGLGNRAFSTMMTFRERDSVKRSLEDNGIRKAFRRAYVPETYWE